MAKGTLLYKYRDPVQLAACLSVAWSPDGECLAVGEVESRIHVFHLPTTHHHILYPGNDLGSCASLDWSADSTQLVAGYADGTVLVWRAASGEIDWTFQDHAGFTYLGWSPDGNCVAYAGYEYDESYTDYEYNEASLYLRDVRDGSIPFRDSLPEQASQTSVAWSPQGTYLAAGDSRGRGACRKQPFLPV